jgi:arsenate reductase (thioredoxin)
MQGNAWKREYCINFRLREISNGAIISATYYKGRNAITPGWRLLMIGRKKKILFLCTGNSCRSQMAEGFVRQLKGELFEPYSAGVEKHGMNARAVKVMAEAGVDISGQRSKLVDELKQMAFDYVVTVCDHAKEVCPVFPAWSRMIHKGFPNPPELAAGAKTEEDALKHYRKVRDQIRAFVETLPEALD